MLRHQVPRQLKVQIDQVIRKNLHQAAVSQVKAHLHQAQIQDQDQELVLRRVLITVPTTTKTTKTKKGAKVAQAQVLVAQQVLVPARAPARVRITLKSLGRNLRRSTPRLKPSWVTIGASAWPRSMLRTAPRPI